MSSKFLSTLLSASKKEEIDKEQRLVSIAIRKNLQIRFRSDSIMKALFLERFKNFDEFHSWRMERHPIHYDGFTLTFLYDSEKSKPESIDDYHWIPFELWCFFYSSNNNSDSQLMTGVRQRNKNSSFYSSVSCGNRTKHVGSYPTELEAHRAWMKYKVNVLYALKKKYHTTLDEVTNAWLELWIMSFERAIKERTELLFGGKLLRS